MKDLLDAFPEPKPKTTVATLLKRMIDKDFVAYTSLVTLENTILCKKRPLSPNT
jgi:hypothetical protein